MSTAQDDFGLAAPRSDFRAVQQERLQQVQQERQQLSKAYRAARRHDIALALDCFEGPRLKKMVQWARKLDISEGGKLVKAVEQQDWLLNADIRVRQTALQLFHTVITRKRENAGLHPFDDPLPWQPDNAFLRIKSLLRVT